MFNKSKFSKNPKLVNKASKPQQLKSVAKGTATKKISNVKGGNTGKKITTPPAQNGAPQKKNLAKAPASGRKVFNPNDYFDSQAGPMGGFRGITTTGKKSY